MMKEMKNGAFSYGDEQYNFNFSTSLSAYEKMIFVDEVVNTIVSDTNYNHVVRDLIFDFIIVDMFTNIDTSFVSMEDEDGNVVNPIIIIEHFLEATNVVDIVKANMKVGLLDELNHAVDLGVQYRTGINPNPLNEAVAGLVRTIESKVNGVNLEDMIGMARKFAGMTDELTVESLVNAYMNSDVHKQNLREIEEAKK